jgi:hypothetical protein
MGTACVVPLTQLVLRRIVVALGLGVLKCIAVHKMTLRYPILVQVPIISKVKLTSVLCRAASLREELKTVQFDL